MKEYRQSIVTLPVSLHAAEVLNRVEEEVKKYWNEGWVFIKAEPDGIFESVCLYFEREIHIG